MPDKTMGRDEARPAEEEGAAALLERLHERALERLHVLLEVLEHEQRAVRTGGARSVSALSDLEASTTREAVAIERAIAAIEHGASAEAAVLRPELRNIRQEHSRLRSAVLERNRATRSLIERELRANRRALVAHRVRMGTPSPFSSVGEAGIVDIRR